MSPPRRNPETYGEIAELVGVRLCERACWMATLEAHKLGYTDTTTVHWMPRSPVRVGIWRFLKLAAQVTIGSRTMRPGERIWLENTMAYDMGLEHLGIRFPRQFADTDRAQVRAWLATGVTLDDETRTRMERWAQP